MLFGGFAGSSEGREREKEGGREEKGEGVEE